MEQRGRNRIEAELCSLSLTEAYPVLFQTYYHCRRVACCSGHPPISDRWWEKIGMQSLWTTKRRSQPTKSSLEMRGTSWSDSSSKLNLCLLLVAQEAFCSESLRYCSGITMRRSRLISIHSSSGGMWHNQWWGFGYLFVTSSVELFLYHKQFWHCFFSWATCRYLKSTFLLMKVS